MTRLYELADEIRAAADAMAEDGVPEQAIFDTIEAMSGSFNDKAIIVAKLAKEAGAKADAIEVVLKSAQERKKAARANAERLEAYLLRCMESAGIERVESPEIDISLVKNSPSTNVTDESLIPRRYWVQPDIPELRIDKALLLRDLKLGPVSGGELAHTKRVKIK